MQQAKFLRTEANFHTFCRHWPPAELSLGRPGLSPWLMQKSYITIRQEIILVNFILWDFYPLPQIPKLTFGAIFIFKFTIFE